MAVVRPIAFAVLRFFVSSWLHDPITAEIGGRAKWFTGSLHGRNPEPADVRFGSKADIG